MSVRIIVDSTADIIDSLKPEFTIVPLSVHFGEEEFIDGITITHERFYEKLIESDVLPTTSQPTPAAFAFAYHEAMQAGDEVVVLTVAAKLSGTYQSAHIAAQDFPEDKIHIVESKSVAIGTAILAEFALQLKKEGLRASEIAMRLEEERENIRLIALLDTLEYLKKGGRISKTAAFAGGLLSIKPVACIEDGEIKVIGKARGSKQGNNLLMQEIAASGGVDFTKPVLLGFTGLDDTMLKKYIADSASVWEGHTDRLRTTAIGSVVGTHAGPGAIAAAFFAKR